jgi:hypothetical protein
MDGKCLMVGLVYQATVTTRVTATHISGTPTETYTGLTVGIFKKRYKSHTLSMKHTYKKTATTSSQHIWSLKNTNTPYTTNWKFLESGRGYNHFSNSCRLGLLEKYLIMFSPEDATLNKKNELFSAYRHKARFMFGNI